MKKARNHKWKYTGKHVKRVPDTLENIPVKCRRCVWRSNKYIAFCERPKCIHEK